MENSHKPEPIHLGQKQQSVKFNNTSTAATKTIKCGTQLMSTQIPCLISLISALGPTTRSMSRPWDPCSYLHVMMSPFLPVGLSVNLIFPWLFYSPMWTEDIDSLMSACKIQFAIEELKYHIVWNLREGISHHMIFPQLRIYQYLSNYSLLSNGEVWWSIHISLVNSKLKVCRT